MCFSAGASFTAGVLLTVVSALFYIRCLTSVWCFFAAVMSFWVFYIVHDEHKKFHFSSHQVRKEVVVS
jgi:hypothetical protein